MNKHHSLMVVSFSLAAALSACGGGGGGSSLPSGGGASNTATTQNTEARTTSSVSTAASYTAIDAGGAATGNWMADVGSNGGWLLRIWSAVNTKLVPSPAPQLVYQTQRWGHDLAYTVPNLTPNGSYAVRLHFVEAYYQAAGKRVFSVKANGQTVVTDLDIYKEAGGANIAIVKSFTSKADAAGKIAVQMTATIDNPAIAGLEFTSQSSTTLPVLPGADINVGGASNGLWIADANFSGGWTKTVTNAIKTNLVSNPAPQAVYQSQRTGTKFAYSIGNMTPNGAYTVRLHFVESWFTSAGQRLFNVSINGSQVLSNFDIYQAAGAANTAIAKAFDVKADANGKIAIALAATMDNASIAGIEIVPATTSTGPTAVPTIIPTPGPAPSATPTAVSGGAWPAAGWQPYTTGPLTVRVAPNPTFTAGSSAIINAMWAGRTSDAGRLEVTSGSPPPNSTDFSQPLYFGHAGDPQYKVSCYEFGGGCPASGETVHIPQGAYPAGGSDHHIAIRDTVTGKDVMLWLAPVPNGRGGAYSVGWGAAVPSNGNGLNAIGGSASGLSALWALRETDLVHNTVTHALVVGVNEESGSGYVYPAVGWDNGYFHSDPWPRMGAHFWLDVPPPYASGCPQYTISYLTALNKYGAYFADQGDVPTPMQASFESDLDYTYNGGASVWGPFMQSQGRSAVGHNVLQIGSCGINMQTHMHILNPPSPG